MDLKTLYNSSQSLAATKVNIPRLDDGDVLIKINNTKDNGKILITILFEKGWSVNRNGESVKYDLLYCMILYSLSC